MPVYKVWEIKGEWYGPKKKRYCKRVVCPTSLHATIGGAPHHRPHGGESKGSTLAVMIIPPGMELEEHVHESYSEESIYIIKGRGEGYVGDEKFAVEPDIVIVVPGATKHRIVNTGDEEIKAIYTYFPPVPPDKVHTLLPKQP
jgi:putative monooxygenase